MTNSPCKLPREHFSDHLDGQSLPLRIRLLVQFHLTVCPPCRRLHESLVATREALSALRDTDVVDTEIPGQKKS